MLGRCRFFCIPIIFLHLCFAVAAAAAAAAAYEPCIPAGIAAWEYPDVGGFGVALPSKHPLLSRRWWQRQHLSEAVWVSGSQQLLPLLRKLKRGEPVNVVAYGSSIIEDDGGLFEPSPEHLAYVNASVHHLPRAYVFWDAAKTKRGWLSLFMHVINMTAPHDLHMLINAGSRANNLEASLRKCMEQHEPPRVDLYILESMGGMTPGRFLEQLVWRLLSSAAARKQPRPAIIILNSARVCPDPVKTEWKGCLASGGALCESMCAPGTPGEFVTSLERPMGDTPADTEHLEAALVGRHYGISVVSQLQLLANALRDGLPQALGNSTCAFLAQVLRDEIHPTELGKLLYTDHMVNLLRTAEEFAREHPGATPPGVPAQPLYHDGRKIELRRCTMVDGQLAGAHNAARVLRQQGWSYVRSYQAHSAVKVKPGLQAEAPGAVLELQLDTQFPEDMVVRGTSMLWITYLTSYENMGIVDIWCMRNCMCMPSAVDGHRPAHTVSVQQQHGIRIDSHPECVVQITVRNTTSSGRHRFKIVNMVISAEPVAKGGELAFEPWTGF